MIYRIRYNLNKHASQVSIVLQKNCNSHKGLVNQSCLLGKKAKKMVIAGEARQSQGAHVFEKTRLLRRSCARNDCIGNVL